MYAIIGRKRFI